MGMLNPQRILLVHSGSDVYTSLKDVIDEAETGTEINSEAL